MSSESRRPLIATVVILALVLPLLIATGLFVRGLVANTFRLSEQTREARELSYRLLRVQLNEETGMRGYTTTRDPVFLQPYREGRADFDPTVGSLAGAVDNLRLPGAARAVTDAKATNAAWLRTVALPLLAHPSNSTASAGLQRNGKVLVDRFRADMATVNDALALRDRAVDADARLAIDRLAFLIVGSVAVVGLLAFGFLVQQSRLAVRLEAERRRAEDERRRSAELAVAYATEKRIADTLQDAFSQRPLPALPLLRFSAMYVPATEESKVGGDWYDALEMPKDRVLFAIGDVAGHGLDAAVGMSRARQALISSALLEEDPALVLGRVNRELQREGAPMVTAIVGYADSRSYEFVYANAGHPPPLLVEPGRRPRLLECGALPLGVMAAAAYETYRVQTVPGAALVLYTDGAVEHSRDVIAGEALLIDAAARSFDVPGPDFATAIHRTIFAGDRAAGDDVAILTIGFETDPATGLTISAEQGQSSFTGRLGGAPEPAGVGASSARRRVREMLRLLASERRAS